MQLDTQAPTYFVAPNFYPTQNAGYDVEDPAKLTKVGVRGEVTVDEIDSALSLVNSAQTQWKILDAKSRATALRTLANRIENMDLTDCAILMSREMGKPYPEAIGELANYRAIRSLLHAQIGFEMYKMHRAWSWADLQEGLRLLIIALTKPI